VLIPDIFVSFYSEITRRLRTARSGSAILGPQISGGYLKTGVRSHISQAGSHKINHGHFDA
jgi:hypothetical protein